MLPPIAAVSVTPIVAERPDAAPNMARPEFIVGSIKKYAMAPMLPPSNAALRAWRPGNNSGDELSKPCSFPYATSDPL